MFLWSSSKTGLSALLVLQLFSLSLYPACGRASFEGEDEDVVEDDEEAEDLTDDQADELQHEDGSEEMDTKTLDDLFLESCAKKFGPSLKLEDCLKKLIAENGGSVEDCAYFKGKVKEYIDCLKLIVGKGKTGSKSGSGEQINWKEKLDDEYDLGTS